MKTTEDKISGSDKIGSEKSRGQISKNAGDIRAKAERLEKFLLERAKTCIHAPGGQLQRSFTTPTYGIASGADDGAAVPERSTVGHYLQMYDWDSYFFSQAAAKLGSPKLPADILLNFLSLAAADGYIPRTVSESRIWDGGDLCKPFLCQLALYAHDSGALSKSELAGCVETLRCYLRYFKEHRGHKSGLYHWRNVLESGVDNNLALIAPVEAAAGENFEIGKFPDGELLAIDLCSYLVMELDALSRLCGLVGLDKEKEEYAAESKKLADLIEQYCWDEKSGLYHNVDPNTMKPFPIPAWTSWCPALFGFAKPDRLERVVHDNILNPEHFLRPHGLTSLAVSNLLCNQSPRGLYGRVIVCNWQGPVWVLPNVLAVRMLLRMGLKSEAKDIASRVVSVMVQDLEEKGTLHENYDCETGAGLWAPQFMSWNILALELIDVVRS